MKIERRDDEEKQEFRVTLGGLCITAGGGTIFPDRDD